MRKLVLFLMVMVALSAFTMPAFAQQPGEAAHSNVNRIAIASGFPIALAAGLAALGQGKVASAACEALARNPAARPGIQLTLILGLAFIESLVLFTLVIIFVKVA